MKKEITVAAPATIANIVCGFDVLGFALQDIEDRLIVQLIDEPIVSIVNNDPYQLPTDPALNVIGGALKAVQSAWHSPIGFKVISTKLIKPGSGIGSSAASAAGAVFAANELLGKPFNQNQLIKFAMEGEFIASQSYHADNIAPALLGGVTMVRSVKELDIIPLEYPELHVAVIHPQVEIKTSESRNLIPKEISLKDGIQQWANVGALVAGLQQKNMDIIHRSLTDLIAEPARKHTIPHFEELQKISKEIGCIGGGIAGSGPSVFYFARTKNDAEKMIVSAHDLYKDSEIELLTYVSRIANQGVRTIEF